MKRMAELLPIRRGAVSMIYQNGHQWLPRMTFEGA